MLSANQFQPAPSNDRKNAKGICVKEEEIINSSLLELTKSEAISDNSYQQCPSVGGQPARLHGLAKVHKKDAPLRPIVSIPGYAYDRLEKVFLQLVGRLPEAKIGCDTKRAGSRL